MDGYVQEPPYAPYENENEQGRYSECQRTMTSGSRAMIPAFSEGRLVQQGNRIQQIKRESRRLAEELEAQMEQETEHERKTIEQAIERMKHKRQEFSSRQDIVAKMEAQQDLADQLEDLMEELQHNIRRVTRAVHRDKSIAPADKRQMIEEIHERVADAVMEPDERDAIRQLQSVLTSFTGSPRASFSLVHQG